MKKNDVHEKIISVFSIAGLMTAFISLITTQQGLKQYTFSKDWQAFFISFSIQSALFVCNMKGPEILKALAGRKKFVLIFFYTIVLMSSSCFSFVYIVDTAYPEEVFHNDANRIMTDEFLEIDYMLNENISNKSQKTVEEIRLCKKYDIFTEIHFVPTKINVDQVDSIMAFAKNEKIDVVNFLGLIPHGRARKFADRLYLNIQDNIKLKNKLHMLEGENVRVGIPLQNIESEYKCYAGRSKLCIRYDGKVFGCEAFKYVQLFDDNGDIIYSDSIYEKNLVDIYYNSVYLKRERNFIEEQMCDGNCQEKCPVQRMMRKSVGF